MAEKISEAVKEHNILIRQQRLAAATGRFGGEFEVAKRHPLKALKVFAMILFDVIAEIRRERKYRKEFKV